MGSPWKSMLKTTRQVIPISFEVMMAARTGGEARGLRVNTSALGASVVFKGVVDATAIQTVLISSNLVTSDGVECVGSAPQPKRIVRVDRVTGAADFPLGELRGSSYRRGSARLLNCGDKGRANSITMRRGCSRRETMRRVYACLQSIRRGELMFDV